MDAIRKRNIGLTLVVALVWLAIGAAANVGTAWWQAVVHERREWKRVMYTDLPAGIGPDKFLQGADGHTWPMRVPADWPKEPDGVLRQSTWLCGKTTADANLSSAFGDNVWISLQEFGWPFRSCCDWTLWFGRLRHPSYERHGSIHTPATDGLPQGYELPARPLWPGFALNTLFYAALAWGLWQVPLAIRRRRRHQSGRCSRCAYDLKGLPTGSPCPECGGKTTS